MIPNVICDMFQPIIDFLVAPAGMGDYMKSDPRPAQVHQAHYSNALWLHGHDAVPEASLLNNMPMHSMLTLLPVLIITRVAHWHLDVVNNNANAFQTSPKQVIAQRPNSRSTAKAP